MFKEFFSENESIWTKLKNTDRRIVLYGMGNGADLILNELERLGIKADGVFASDDFVRGQTFRGFKVGKYSDFVSEYGKFTVLVAFGTSRAEVIENIIKISREQEVYSVDVPVYGGNIFNDGFVNENIEKIEYVYEKLYDEKSKNIYENIIRFKYTGKLEYLFAAESPSNDKYGILNLSDDEVYLDLGAYNGDTVKEFCENVPSYRKIIAVEPDRKTFAKLCANVEKYENTAPVNVCICDFDGETEFNGAAGRNSSKGGGKIIKCKTVDTVLNGERATFIKADVEGAESEMLDGAKFTLSRYKPKMAISCYHRTEDIFALPLKVLEIRDDYKIHIRHYRYIPCWDTEFYFI